DILLDLHELVDAKQAADVLAGAAGLAAEAWRVASIEDRQPVALDDLARMERSQRDLCCPGQPDIVVGQFVRLFLVAGELALIEEGLLAGDGGDRDRREVGGG